MQTKHLPRSAGIYQIMNTVTGKLYIGSAADVQKRALGHRYELTRQTHHNCKLQRAWNKYGAEAFLVRVIEPVSDLDRLIEREQSWIDLTGCVQNGYNIAHTAGSVRGLIRTEAARRRNSHARAKPIVGFISPNGEPTVVENLRDFCQLHGLEINPMRAVAGGVSTSHKGWTHVNGKQKQREWIRTFEGFIDPDGKPVEPIENLEAFCRERGLIASNMNKVYRGAKPSHKGWTHVRSVSKRGNPRHVQMYRGFVSPSGERVEITNLTKFCRENALDHATLYKVLMGQYPQHKGWTYAKPRTGL